MDSPTIFVGIPSYRDPELLQTINDCIQCADRPDRLAFGICNQHDEQTRLNDSADDWRIKNVPYPNSKGLGWARETVRGLYRGEDYILQLDSHMRFRRGWDTYLLTVFTEAVDAGISRPLISASCRPWDPRRPGNLDPTGVKICFGGFSDRRLIKYKPQAISDVESRRRFIPGVFVSGHFIFASGDFYQKLYFDSVVFFEEEIPLTLRSFSLGYDVIHPTESFVFHLYERDYRELFWSDVLTEKHGQGQELMQERRRIQVRRAQQLCEIKDWGIDLGNCGLGDDRSLDEWIKRAHIDIRRQRIIGPEAML